MDSSDPRPGSGYAGVTIRFRGAVNGRPPKPPPPTCAAAGSGGAGRRTAASDSPLRRALHLLAVTACLTLAASPVYAWEFILNPPQSYFPTPHPEHTYFNRLATDGAGDVIACGVVTFGGPPAQITVVKLSGRDGELIWQQVVDGSINHRAANDCNALSVDGQGDVFVGGRVTVISYEVSQFVLVKLAGDSGRPIWSRRLGDTMAREQSALYSLTIDPLGDVVALGTVRSAGYGNTLVKFDGGTGAEVWHVPAGGAPSTVRGGGVATDSHGDAIVAIAELLSRNFGRLRVAKRSGVDGGETWRYELLRPPLYSVDLVLDPGSDPLVADTTSVLKLAGATGLVQWVRPVPAAGVSVDPSGGAIAALTGGVGLVRLPAGGGESLWQRINDPELYLADSTLGSAGEVAATGSLRHAGADDLAVLKLDGATGLERWRRTFSDDLGAEGTVVAVDAGGDIVAAGSSSGISLTPWGEEYVDHKAVVVKVWGRTGAGYPPTPLQLLSALGDTILGLGLPRNVERGLMREVNESIAILSDADPATDSKVADHLEQLIRRVTTLRGKTIPSTAADEILALAQAAIAAIEGA